MHYEEVSPIKSIPFSPDREAYFALDDAGIAKLYTAREDRLVGYALFFVRTHLHHSTSLQAMQDALFIHPDYRQGGNGVHLIRYAERDLKARGVDVIMHHALIGSRLDELLGAMGYSPLYTLRAKVL